MKKLISLFIATAMILSTLAVCILPAAAAGAQFEVTIARENLFEDYPEADRKSVPGYIYAEDGLRVNPLDEGDPEDEENFKDYSEYRATWPNNTPYYTVQTGEEWSLRNGFYMEVRIDAFTAGGTTDRWFGFSIWDSKSVQLGQVGVDSQGRDWGTGVETLVRMDGETNKANRLQWYDDTQLVKSNRLTTGINEDPMIYKEDNGKQILTLEIKFNSKEGMYEVLINDVAAPDDYCESLTDWLDKRNDKAFVGFSLQSAFRNGEASVTVTKIGTSKDSADTPLGTEDDWVKAIQRDNTLAEIKAKDTVLEGEPAIHITGDPDSYKMFKSVAGGTIIKIDEEGNFNLELTSTSSQADPQFRVKNEVSYDHRDFPVMFIMMKNFCTCAYVDHDGDGEIDPGCYDNEHIGLYYLAGDSFDGSFLGGVTFDKIEGLNFTDADGNTYSAFCLDMTEYLSEFEDAQRIHGFMLNIMDVKIEEIGRNTFDIVSLSYFASQEEAEVFAQTYYDENLEEAQDTEAPIETETETVTETEEATTEEVTTEEVTTEEETTEEVTTEEATTEAPEEETEAATGGCGSVAGFGAMAIVAVAAIGFVSFKKREE